MHPPPLLALISFSWDNRDLGKSKKVKATLERDGLLRTGESRDGAAVLVRNYLLTKPTTVRFTDNGRTFTAELGPKRLAKPIYSRSR